MTNPEKNDDDMRMWWLTPLVRLATILIMSGLVSLVLVALWKAISFVWAL